MINRILTIILIFSLVSFAFGIPALAEQELELEGGNYYTLYDEDNNILLRTAIVIHVGDKFIDHNNIHYLVVKVDPENFKAYAKRLKNDEIIKPTFSEFSQLEGADEQRIGLYYTHSGESYVPTDGYAQTDQKRGGIYAVGEALASALEEFDIEVINDRTTHFPYSGSYRRSRRTVSNLLESDLDAIFDIHRDATPVDAYLEEIEDEKITQILIVVGNQNPARSVNEEFAWQLKAVADEEIPNLVKGIFYARGSYNQDLHPRSLLLEIGAHTNRREQAERGAELFASVVAKTLYGEVNAPRATRQLEEDPDALVDEDSEENDGPRAPIVQSTTDHGGTGGGGLLRGFITVILLTVIGGGGYLLISVGDTREIEKKIRGFFTKEFANTLAAKRGRRRK